MKQTAVEWLIEEMIKRDFFNKNKDLSFTTLEHLGNEAKKMEKQQMIDFHIGAMKLGLKHEGGEEWKDSFLPKIKSTAEQYYNKTFTNNQVKEIAERFGISESQITTKK